MNFTRSMTTALAMMALFAVSLPVGAQEAGSGLKNPTKRSDDKASQTAATTAKKTGRGASPRVIPVDPAGDSAE